jgi:hypothetical protein
MLLHILNNTVPQREVLAPTHRKSLVERQLAGRQAVEWKMMLLSST